MNFIDVKTITVREEKSRKRLTRYAGLIAGASLLTAGLAGCNEGVMVAQTVTVAEVFEDAAPMGCMGTNWNTIVRSDDNKVSRLCGKFGKPGDKIAGCWRTGHWDSVQNGFRRDC